MSTEYAEGLRGRRVVVAGGSGAIGEGLTKSYLAEGAEVIVLSRSEAGANRVRDFVGDELRARLSVVVGDYTSFAGARDTAQRVEREYGKTNDIVASIGGWWQGNALCDTSEGTWQKIFMDLAQAHFAIAQAWVPRLSPKGVYHLIIGGAGILPVAGSGIVSMQQAALLMMGDVLAVEAPEKRIFRHILGPVNNRRRPSGRPEWVDVSDIGTLATFLSAHPYVGSRQLRQLDKAEFDRVYAEVKREAEGATS